MYTINPTLDSSGLIKHITKEFKVAITNHASAKSYLNHINYSRLYPYLLRLSVVEPGINFSKVIKYYDLDRKLKLLAMDGIERIEISFKALFLSELVLSTKDEVWYANTLNYHNSEAFHHSCVMFFQYISGYKDLFLHNYLSNKYLTFNQEIWDGVVNCYTKQVFLLKQYLKDLKKIREENHQIAENNKIHRTSLPLNHLPLIPKVKYKDIFKKCSPDVILYLTSELLTIPKPYSHITSDVNDLLHKHSDIDITSLLSFLLYSLKIPFYLIVESLILGQLSNFFPRLAVGYRQMISNKIKSRLPVDNVNNHLEGFCKLRNIIAHHDRLFNDNKLIKIDNFDKLTNFNSRTAKAYFDLIKYYLDIIAPNNTFEKKLNFLTNRYVSTYNICLYHWGFH